TDSAGETRSSKTQVPLRFNPIQSRINVDANATDDNSLSVQVNVSGMSSEQTETGTLVVYRHSPPAEVDRFEKQDSENYQPLSPTTWPKVEVMRKEATVESGQEPSFDLDLKAGDYSIEWQVIHDGETLSSAFATSTIWPTRESIPEFSFGLPLRVWLSNTSMEPGGKVDLRWSAGHDNAHVWVEATHRNQPLEINDETASGWNKGPDQSGLLTIPVNESMRGGIQVSVWCVHQQQLHQKVFNISVPWTNKNLKIKWKRFVDKLSPGQPETWTAIIQRSPGLHEDNKLTPAAAHMIATLYDASLDAFVEHRFSSLTGVFRQNYGLVQRLSSTNQTLSLQSVQNNQRLNFLNERYMWPSFDPSLSPQYGRFARGMPMPMAAAMGAGMRGRSMNEANVDFMMAEAEVADAVSSPSEDFGEPGKLASGNKSDFNLDLDQVPLRENLTETAFFYPSIITEKDGTIKISFTPPEALTQWNFLAFAHDTELRSGQLSGVATTSLPLMIQPNLPRFVRMGDEIYLSARVTNTSPSKVVGQANLKLQHPFTEESVDALVANQDSRKDFELEAGRSTSLFWRLDVSDDSKLLDGLTYKIAASDGTVSDGQRGYLPVLSQRVLVSESISMPFRTIGKHDFELKGLLASDGDPGILHRSLTLRVVSNPSWYAILGLPYLMEYPHECSEQTFNRYYANLLARHIVISNPKIERVFNQWRKAGDLRSPLESNESLKSVSIAETPWVRAAQNESTSRAAVARLFEINTIDASLTSALNKLTQMQRDDGFWPWFTGGPQNRYLTLYIATGFARLKHLGLNPPTASLDRAIAALDNWMSSRFAKLKNRKDYQPSSLDALYLYMRTFEINRLPVPKQYRAAFDFYVAKCQTQRMKLGSLQSESHLALALHRLGKESSAKDIAEAVLERGIESEELGLHWNLNQTWWWYQAPIETQAVIIEMLDELPGFESNVIDAKAWLIKQQQTNRWATTKATADAIYAIILRGADELADASLTQASVGGKPVKAEGVQAGSGSYDKRWTEASIKPEMARVTVNHPRDGVAWASLHWQYMNDIANIEAGGEDSLAVKKELFIRRGTPQGPRLYPIQGDGQAVVKVGDEIVTRVVITADRDYEFVHVRDHRGSGTEPVDVNSGYQYSGGMGYYQSTRDTATNFFIGRLPIGRHVMEYSVRVQLAGTYQTGMTHVQCMYAPEFESHSQSIELKVGGQQLEISTE
ncbi:MAG: alpha-2-macroglobulin family protein, partial [Planctomycetota bacterium]